MHIRTVFIAAALLFALGLAAAAATEGDPAKGRTLAKRCICHQQDLDGKSYDLIVKQLELYKDGKGENKAMISIAKKLSPQDVEDLAAYYSSK